MSSSQSTDRRRAEYEPPVQPSSFPSPTASNVAPEETPNAEPIPSDELPAASPLRNQRPARERAKRSWFPIALLLVLVGGLIGAATLSPAANRGANGLAAQRPPGADLHESGPAASPSAP